MQNVTTTNLQVDANGLRNMAISAYNELVEHMNDRIDPSDYEFTINECDVQEPLDDISRFIHAMCCISLEDNPLFDNMGYKCHEIKTFNPDGE